MLEFVIVTALLVAVTVAIHAIGIAAILAQVTSYAGRPPKTIWAVAWIFIRVTWMLLIFHVLEVVIWGLYFFWEGCLPDLETAIYFSGVSYFTIGYGDVLLAKPWRMVAPIEGATGILMCGLSTGLFFAIVTRIYAARTRRKVE